MAVYLQVGSRCLRQLREAKGKEFLDCHGLAELISGTLKGLSDLQKRLWSKNLKWDHNRIWYMDKIRVLVVNGTWRLLGSSFLGSIL